MGERLITSFDGTRIFAREDGPATGRPLLLSNSLGCTVDMWQPQMAAFAEKFRVIRYDGRGHGRSDAPGGDYTIEMLARDALSVLDAFAVPRADVLGLSIGGTVALWLAINRPERVDRLVVANSAPVYPMPDLWTMLIETARTKGPAETAPWFLERWFTEDFRRDHAAEYAALLKTAETEVTAKGYAGFCAALRAVDLRSGLAGIKAPTLFIAGRHDATPIEVVEQVVAAVPGAKLAVLEAAHISNIEAPAAFTDAALGFLGEGAAAKKG
jgi:3-oxoadipate enol-lactonase